MNRKVRALLNLMKEMGVTINDLLIYDDSIETTKKFPLEVYFSDQTRSFDVEHYYKGKHRTPEGVIIGNTVFALANRAQSIECGVAERYCNQAFSRDLTGTLPTEEQVALLTENLDLYEQISVFLQQGRLGKNRLAIADESNSDEWQNYYNMQRGIKCAHNSWTLVLPVINLEQ